MKKLLKSFFITLVTITTFACSKEAITTSFKEIKEPLLTRAIVPEVFDWETADWMPTPSGQAQIPMPWGGQGSISGFYGLDVVNDYRKKDGWRMVYSAFRNYGEELIDPYFMLYNIYRGTLRIYFFLTNPYIGESTYLQDILHLNYTNGATSKILNYLGTEIIDARKDVTKFEQIQPKMLNGGAPLTGRRWYMMEYEMAYDPNIVNLTSDQTSLSWTLNYYDINNIVLNGTEKSEIYGTVGGSDNFLNDAISEAAGTLGKGVLSIIGLGTLEKLTINEETGENKIGLREAAFKSIVDGIKSTINSSSASLPGVAINILNAVFGGNSSSTAKIVSLKSNTSIKLSGTFTSHGAVSSTPIEFKIPGTIIYPNSSGFVPLYNKPLGIFYWKGGVTVHINEYIRTTIEPDDIMGTGDYRVHFHTAMDSNQDYSKYVIINPSVAEIADVSIVSQEVCLIDPYSKVWEFPLQGTVYESPWEYSDPIPTVKNIVVKILFEVSPKDGSPSTYITKTFDVDYKWTKEYLN